MIHRTDLLKARMLFCVIVWTIAVTGQSPTPRSLDESKTLNYGFVSPNTGDNSKIEDAIKNLGSVDESNLLQQASNLGCRVRRKLTAFRALGSWRDGAEHSVLLRLVADEAEIRYLISKLGQDANQKSVLYFHDRPRGPSSIYILRSGKQIYSLRAIAKLMDQSGIAFRTLVPSKKGIVIYVVDLKRELYAKVVRAARRLGARMQIKTGNAEFIGDDVDRRKAKVVFEREIKDYEAKHPNMPATCR